MSMFTGDGKEPESSTSSTQWFSVGDDKESESSTSTQWSQPCGPIEYSEILKATQNFDDSLVIGRGGFGKVYKGNIPNEASFVVAAIKRLDPKSSQGPVEFWAEVKMLSILRHRNIVSLIGYCIHEQEKILIYEYMPNGTLDDHLHKHGTHLPWLWRLNICIGAALGLRYLHNDVDIDSGIIHRDFKSTNILLHESWTAKISDFGLSKTCPTNQLSTHVNTDVKGSYGYFDPNYCRTGELTRKSDVYAFGVVLLEVLCRRPALERLLDGEVKHLATWAQDFIKEGKLKHITDPDIRGEISPKCLKEFARIAERCLRDDPGQRPTMVGVVVTLESIRSLQEKFNMQATGRTIFSRVVDMLSFPSNGGKSVQGSNNRIASSIVRADNIMFPHMNEVPADSQSLSQRVKEFMFADLAKATSEFSPDLLLSEGGFGDVFLGWVDQHTLAPSKDGDGIAVAVKRLNHKSSEGYIQLLAQVNFLGNLAHPNIITLLGYCRYEPEHLLVYEYMPNKSFHHILFKEDIVEPLSWGTRLSIMIGVARGLTYLHSRNIIHHNLTSSNILLDEDFHAKLGGFGLAKYGSETGENDVIRSIDGTFGYLDPEYWNTGRSTVKSDIYAFGVVLLESITAQRPVDDEREWGLVQWANKFAKLDKGNVMKIMDPRLKHNYHLKDASKCFALALRCVADSSKDRPSSEEVLLSLEKLYAPH